MDLMETAQNLIRDDAEHRRTIQLGGASAQVLETVLTDAHRVYQGWLKSGDATLCMREIAASRLIVIEEVLGQLGVDWEAVD